MRVRVVPLERLSPVMGEAWVDTGRRPFVRDGVAFVPVADGYPCDEEIHERRKYRGRGYQMVGDIALIHGRAPTAEETEEIRAWARPSAILHIRGYDGVMRRPEVTVLCGASHDVVHHEAGIIYRLDPAKVMFSMGNREEKMRLEAAVRASGREERCADMFAGIGYFTLPAGRAGARVHAMEINPASHAYLKENIRENSLTGRVRAECGDCRDLLAGVYDRVLMGHFDAAHFLPDALAHVRSGSVLHVHSIGDISGAIADACRECGMEAEISVRNVKKYAPGRWHMVQDVVIQ
ncbi:methyltransferase [Methanomicrobiaceae archaeon CYW5]|uniref:class I SAM-dependent methyltransferase n=1 Tax=Methanovulcanius yangii TaxID=1789227 RepID=UPI0029CA8DCF|nr:SAM-dependent methyltransferase [Methanovulcanius yangii]MBT8507391.1 methyltransferase [Methanovulcanius yangii]